MLKPTLVLSVALCSLVSLIAAPKNAAAQTKRTGYVRIENNTGKEMEMVTVSHKYSDVYKETYTWWNLPTTRMQSFGFAGVKTTLPMPYQTKSYMKVNYNTGAFTTGKDWWFVTWKIKGDPKVYITNPKNGRVVIDYVEGLGKELGPVVAKIVTQAVVTKKAGAVAGEISGEAAQELAKPLTDALMNSESTAGYKQHILRTEDRLGSWPTTISISKKDVTFRSKSGKSVTGISSN